MFGDAEHYKYLTNEADLNNVGDDSIALTPKTPKKVRKNNNFNLIDNKSKTKTKRTKNLSTLKEELHLVTSPISIDDLNKSRGERPQQQQQETKLQQQYQQTNGKHAEDSGKKFGNSVGNMSIVDSNDGSYFNNNYDSTKNINETDNIPVEARPKAAG